MFLEHWIAVSSVTMQCNAIALTLPCFMNFLRFSLLNISFTTHLYNSPYFEF